MLGFFCFCLSELIEDLASRRDTKIGRLVSNDESMIKFENLREIFTPLQKKWKTIFHTFSIQNKGLHYHNINYCTTLQ